MINRASWVVGLGLVVSSVVGCGTSPLDAPPSVMSTSFSPSSGTTAAGAPADDLWWKYRANGGAAVPVQVNGASGTMTVGDISVHLTSGGTKRETTFGMSITVSEGGTIVTNHATSTADETLMVGPPAATVSESLHQEQQLSAPGESIHVMLQTMSTPAMPLVDFGDRPDLDQLPVGHADEVMVRVTATATATASAPGQVPQSDTKTATSDVHVVWTVMAQLPSMTVLGKPYDRVTEIQQQSDATDTLTLMTSSTTNTTWLAAGIGAIKTVTNADSLPTSITEELLDTNLGLQ
jgi:hypothetical protein